MERDVVLNLLNQGIVDLKSLKTKLKCSSKTLLPILTTLSEEGLIYANKSKEIYGVLKKGIIETKDAGYGFIHVEDEDEDYYVSAKELACKYDQDVVLFYPYADGQKLLNAKIVKVLERGHNFIIGSFFSKSKKGKVREYVASTNPKFRVTAIVKRRPKEIKEGIVVYGKIEYVGTAIYVDILEILGHKDDPGIEITKIALEYGFQAEFPIDVIEEITSINEEVSEDELVGRRDFTDKLIFTIDGDDSKDYDDAISLEIDDDGNYHLGVYIADVSHYVKEDAPLDKEALIRGTSVYLADRVIPMLPHKLSNGICSLNEGVKRLVLACLMTISNKGKLLDYEIVEGVIKSKHRMTYSIVNKILNNDPVLCLEYADLVDTLSNMHTLAKIIRNKRHKKGSLEFEVPEYSFTLNLDGSPKKINKRVQDEAEKLIEDFMLMANETVAYNMSIMNFPSIYRVHEKPDQDKLRDTFLQFKDMGINVNLPKQDITSKHLQDILDNIKDYPAHSIYSNMLLRSMMKAKYAANCYGHYGLAMQYYCHFTSPIRRYPDLMVHRILKRLFLHPVNLEEDINHFQSLVGQIATKNSYSEKNAVECERACNDMLFAWFMESHIDEIYHGIITSTPSFGIYVTLENGVEGLVRLDNMIGYFFYDALTMTYSNGKRSYSLGDRVDVIVVGASRSTRKIDFMFKEDYEGMGDFR